MGDRESRTPGYIAVIPAEVRYDAALPANAKLLYGEITALAGADGYCWAGNDYFASLYGVDKCTISRWVSKLQKRGHVRVEVVREKGGSGAVEERRIYIGRAVTEAVGGIDKKINTPMQKSQGGIDEKVIANKDELTRKNIPPIVPHGDSVLFDRFWAAYPKKKDKQAARRAWKKLKPDLALCRVMSAALERQKESREWRKEGGAYIPYPSTWLNGRRWEDEEPEPPGLPDEPPPMRPEGGRYL